MCAVGFKNSSLQNWKKRVFGRERDDFQFCEQSTYVDIYLSIYLPTYLSFYLLTYLLRKREKWKVPGMINVEVLNSPVCNVYVHSFIHSFTEYLPWSRPLARYQGYNAKKTMIRLWSEPCLVYREKKIISPINARLQTPIVTLKYSMGKPVCQGLNSVCWLGDIGQLT